MRYFIAFVTALGLFFLLIFLLFHGGGSKPKQIGGKPLSSYASTTAQAQLVIDGPVNSDQLHQAVRITVDNQEVTFEHIKGYQDSVVSQQSFTNNENAYVNFLFALQHAGFALGNNDPKFKDERGYCPLGTRYVFRLTQDGQDIERYWATSCGSPKTYGGLVDVTLTLFKAQVPNYIDLTENVRL